MGISKRAVSKMKSGGGMGMRGHVARAVAKVKGAEQHLHPQQFLGADTGKHAGNYNHAKDSAAVAKSGSTTQGRHTASYQATREDY